MFYLIKWIGQGIVINGTWFKPDSKKDGFYLVGENLYSYLKDKFSKQFELIEKIKSIDKLTIDVNYIERV